MPLPAITLPLPSWLAAPLHPTAHGPSCPRPPPAPQDVVSEVLRLTGGRGVRAVYDGVGAATFDASLACLDKLGWMVSFGNASGKVG